MPTVHVHVWAENARVGVSQGATETMGIWLDKGDLTTQRIDNQVREHVREITKSMGIINKQGSGPEQWDVLIDCCVTQNSDLVSKRLLGKRYMADKTNLDGQKLKEALNEFVGVRLRRTKNWLEDIATKKSKFVHLNTYPSCFVCSS
jgi:hypothetical protein